MGGNGGGDLEASGLGHLEFAAGGDELEHGGYAVGEGHVLFFRIAAVEVALGFGVSDKLAAGSFGDGYGAEKVEASIDEFGGGEGSLMGESVDDVAARRGGWGRRFCRRRS